MVLKVIKRRKWKEKKAYLGVRRSVSRTIFIPNPT
jgi:hypothetical protein